MRKCDRVIIFKDWQEEKRVIEDKFKGIFIEKCPSNLSVCDVFLANNGQLKKIGQVPSIYLYGGGNRLRQGLNEHVKEFAKEENSLIAISTRLNEIFDV